MSDTFDVIVLGAGAMGSAAAYYLSRANLKTLLLEQFEIDHQRGSSYGHSRIIRYAYPETDYIELMKSAYPLWYALEMAAHETLYTKTGGLDFGPASSPDLQRTIQALAAAGISHEILSPEELKTRFPQFSIPHDTVTLYQEDSGILAASRCVKTHIRLAQQHKTLIVENEPVKSIRVHGDTVSIETTNNRYSAARLVIAGGAWTNDMLEHLGLHLPLTPMRCQLSFFDDETKLFQAPHMPVFISHFSHPQVYGIGNVDNTGLKIALHGGDALKHVSEVDYTPDETPLALIRDFASQYLPSAQLALKSARVCLYTMTPDEDFIIDQHPEYPNIAIAAGFSGHGFKFSTLVGKILSDLMIEGRTDHKISRFSLARLGQISL